MRKNRTSGRRLARQCAAVFLGTAALWLVWLTADLSGLWTRLAAAAADSGLAEGALQAELSLPGEGGLPFWDRLVLAQADLLSPPSPDPVPNETPAPVSPAPSAPSSPSPEPTASGAALNIIGRTMVAGTSAKYVTWEGLSIYNHTNYALDIEQLLANAPKLDLTGDAPTVLIFHSHATEAYTPTGAEDAYKESDRYRTLDTERSIVRVGSEITAILEDAGIRVIHDTTLFDYPNYNDAYIRSSAAVDQWLAQYPSIRLVIDLHRDALEAEDGTIYKTVAGTVDNCAQIMLVMGSDAMGQQHPNWRVNLSLAVEVQSALCAKWATLARPIVLRPSRFNQHQSTGELLVEIGTHGNTLQEAITAGRLLARTIVELGT